MRLVDVILNVFCPTGPGGGIKPNCSVKHSADTGASSSGGTGQSGSSKSFKHGETVTVRSDATIKRDGQVIPHPRAGQQGSVHSEGLSKVAKKEDAARGATRITLPDGKIIVVKSSDLVKTQVKQEQGYVPKYQKEGGVVLTQKTPELEIGRSYAQLRASGNKEHLKEFLDDVVSKKGRQALHTLASDVGIPLGVNPGGKGTDLATAGTIRDRILAKEFGSSNG